MNVEATQNMEVYNKLSKKILKNILLLFKYHNAGIWSVD